MLLNDELALNMNKQAFCNNYRLFPKLDPYISVENNSRYNTLLVDGRIYLRVAIVGIGDVILVTIQNRTRQAWKERDL